MLGCATSGKAQNPPKPPPSPVQNAPQQTGLMVPSPGILHGIGFSRYSNFDEERSYKEARRNAEIDLAASIMTSVYLEYFGTSTLPTQLKSEYGISDSLQVDRILAVDSTRVGDWAVYIVKDVDRDISFPENAIELANSTPWAIENFEPVKVDGYWLAAGFSENNDYNPDRSWALAKQEALKNLSLYLSTVIKSNQREYDNSYRSINYTTSKHIFSQIGVIGRRFVDNKTHVLLLIKEEHAHNFEN